MLPDPKFKKIDLQASTIVMITIETNSVGPELLLVAAFETGVDSIHLVTRSINTYIIPFNTVVIHPVFTVTPC